MNQRQRIRAMARERMNEENKRLAKQYGIPKAFVAHARRHGNHVVDIIREYTKNKSTPTL